MNPTKKGSRNIERLTSDTPELCQMLNCGRETAVKIGMNAGARIKVGRRVLWNVDKIQKYLDSISE